MGEDDGEAPLVEYSPTKVLGGLDIGVDDEGVSGAPSRRCISGGESS